MDPVQIRNEVKLGLENGEKDYAGDLIGTKKYLREKYKWEEGIHLVNKGAHSTQDRLSILYCCLGYRLHWVTSEKGKRNADNTEGEAQQKM